MVVVNHFRAVHIVISILDIVMLDELSINMFEWHSHDVVLIMVNDCWLTVSWNAMNVMMDIVMHISVVW